MEVGKDLKNAILNIDDIGGLIKRLERSEKYHSVEFSDNSHFNVSRYKSNKDKTPMPFQKVKIGRFFRNIFEDLDDYDIEYLSNKMVAYNKLYNSDIELKVLKGDDIYRVYNQDNYLHKTGTLGNSCMRHSQKSNLLSLYANNDNCSVVVYEVDGKIASRALLWTLDDGSKYLDRVYSVYDYMTNVYESYAIENKYSYFKNREYLSPNENGEYVRNRSLSSITLSYIPEVFPYLDTFFILYNDKLYSYTPEREGESYRYKQLRSTTGTFNETNLPIPLQRGLVESYRQRLSNERTTWLIEKTNYREDDIQYLFNLSGGSFIALKSNIEKIINTNSEIPSSVEELSEILLKDNNDNFSLGLYKSVSKQYPEHFYNEDGTVIQSLVDEYNISRGYYEGFDISDEGFNVADYDYNADNVYMDPNTGEIDLTNNVDSLMSRLQDMNREITELANNHNSISISRVFFSSYNDLLSNLLSRRRQDRDRQQ